MTSQSHDRPATIFDACSKGDVHSVIEFIYKEASSDGESRLVHIVDSRDLAGDFPLHLAAGSGHCDVVNVLLDNKANVHVVRGDGDTPLHVACSLGYLDIVKCLVSAGGDPYARNFKNFTPLHGACANAHLEVAKFLLNSKSVDVNARAKDGATPLYCAYEKFHRDVIKFLIENGGQCDMISRLHMYSMMGNLAKVTEMIMRGCDVNARDGSGRTPIHVACFMGFPDVVEELAKCGAYLNVKDTAEMTPLLYACMNGNILAASILRDREADHKIRQKDGKTGLHLAAMYGHQDMVEAMLSIVAAIGGASGKDRILAVEWPKTTLRRHSNKNDKDYKKRLSNRESWSSSRLDFDITKQASTQELCKEPKSSPFKKLKDKFKKHKVKRMCSSECVSSLAVMLEFLEALDEQGQTPLMLACKNGHAAVVSTFIEIGANCDVTDRDGNTCLHVTCQGDFTDIAVNLLQAGANLNVKNNTGETPLHACVKNGNIALVNMFINHRVKVDAVDMLKQTSLHIACRHGQVVIARHLILSGARVSARDLHDMTALHIACLHKQYQVVLLLLENSASLNITDASRNSPFHYACRSGDVDSVRTLLQRERISINAFGEFGTPLFEACANGHVRLVRLLLEKGANVKAYGKTGTPLHGACEGSHVAIVKILLDHNSNVNATNREGDTPLHVACRRAVRHPDAFACIDAILSRDKTSLAMKNSAGRTPLMEIMNAIRDSQDLAQIQGGINLHRGSTLFKYENDVHLSALIDRLLIHDTPISDAIFEIWNREEYFRYRNLILYYTAALATKRFSNTFPVKALRFFHDLGDTEGMVHLQKHAGVQLFSGALEKEPDLVDGVRDHVIVSLPLTSLCVARIRRMICKSRCWVSREVVLASTLPEEAKKLILVEGLFSYGS